MGFLLLLREIYEIFLSVPCLQHINKLHLNIKPKNMGNNIYYKKNHHKNRGKEEQFYLQLFVPKEGRSFNVLLLSVK